MFVAVWPDHLTQERLTSLEIGTTEGLKRVGSGNWHVTLRFLGEVNDDLVPALVEALEIAARTLSGPLQCVVGPKTAWFGGDRVLQLPVFGLDQAASAVRSATIVVVPDKSLGEQPFNGHLTIARSRRRDLNHSAKAALAGIPFAATFEVAHFDLVASQREAEGRRYTTVATVPLLG